MEYEDYKIENINCGGNAREKKMRNYAYIARVGDILGV
jgi:hypothetical protein